jgi:hypothetical protein
MRRFWKRWKFRTGAATPNGADLQGNPLTAIYHGKHRTRGKIQQVFLSVSSVFSVVHCA